MTPISIFQENSKEQPFIRVNAASLTINFAGCNLITKVTKGEVYISFLTDDKFPNKLFLVCNDNNNGYCFYKTLRSGLSISSKDLPKFFYDFFKLKAGFSHHDNPTILIEPETSVDNIEAFPLSVLKNNN